MVEEGPLMADFVCEFCGHAWTSELGINDKNEDHIKCPKCGKDGGRRVD